MLRLYYLFCFSFGFARLLVRHDWLPGCLGFGDVEMETTGGADGGVLLCVRARFKMI